MSSEVGTPAKPLNGTQKVAVVLMNMDQASAAEVMKQFTADEAEEITAEIIRLRRVDAETADLVVAEFHELAVTGRLPPRGGKDVAVRLLQASFGSEQAAGVMSRVASAQAGRAFEFLDAIDPGQILTLLDGELPQTVALVLAHLRPDLSSAVMAALNAPLRTDVAQAIALMGTATPEAVDIVAETLKLRAGAVVAPRDNVRVVGGIQPLVEILNRANVATEKALMESLEERDPVLAEELRSRMLTFADIVQLESRDLQKVLRGIQPDVLALAMKSAPSQVTDVIRQNVSERNREILDDEIRAVGPVRMSQVEEARAEIVRSIRDLEAAGEITVQRGSEEDELVV